MMSVTISANVSGFDTSTTIDCLANRPMQYRAKRMLVTIRFEPLRSAMSLALAHFNTRLDPLLYFSEYETNRGTAGGAVA